MFIPFLALFILACIWDARERPTPPETERQKRNRFLMDNGCDAYDADMICKKEFGNRP